MKFNYRGITRQQEEVNGTLEANDEFEARLRLRSQQIRPLRVVAVKASILNVDLNKFKGNINISLGPAINLKGLVVFTRQFSSLVDAGVAIVQCLDILYQQEKRPAFKKILGQVKQHIEGGGGLAEALNKHPKTFSEFFIRVVEAGEISGTIDKALRRVGIQLEKLNRLKAKVIGAMIYPLITFVTAIGVLLFLLLKVIPEVSKLYAESSAELPQLTQMVLGLSSWVEGNFQYLLGGMAATVVGSISLYRVPAFREVFDPFFLQTPLFGTLVKKSSIARFTRTMSTLVSSGVPLLSSFEICVKLSGNIGVKRLLQKAMAAVSEGKTIAVGLQSKNIFPPMVTHMINIGELTGKLDELLGKVADIYDEEVDDAVSNLTGLLQPLMIVVVGIIIAFLLLSMYLPIFQLAEKVTGGA